MSTLSFSSITECIFTHADKLKAAADSSPSFHKKGIVFNTHPDFIYHMKRH